MDTEEKIGKGYIIRIPEKDADPPGFSVGKFVNVQFWPRKARARVSNNGFGKIAQTLKARVTLLNGAMAVAWTVIPHDRDVTIDEFTDTAKQYARHYLLPAPGLSEA
jgi:hypothetical protein